MVHYTLDFADTSDGGWYTEAVRWAVSEGVIWGCGNGEFGPNDDVTREQMVTILRRYAQYKGYDLSAGENTSILSCADAARVAEYAALSW